MYDVIHNIISKIKPYDALEKEHLEETLSWINSGEPIFRITKPDIPNKHLVSYFVLFDEINNKILLVDHKNACLWLPSGGHVELNENPKDTVKRECIEELGIHADFLIDNPIFLTKNITVGMTAGHTDVTLWYITKGECNTSYKFDTAEFNSIKWFDLDNIPYERSDPHMQRFINKLRGIKNNAFKL